MNTHQIGNVKFVNDSTYSLAGFGGYRLVGKYDSLDAAKKAAEQVAEHTGGRVSYLEAVGFQNSYNEVALPQISSYSSDFE